MHVRYPEKSYKNNAPIPHRNCTERNAPLPYHFHMNNFIINIEIASNTNAQIRLFSHFKKRSCLSAKCWGRMSRQVVDAWQSLCHDDQSYSMPLGCPTISVPLPLSNTA